MDQLTEKIEVRNSSYELLRIISIAGILYMHMLGVYGSGMSSRTQILRVCSDSLFNAGVTCFILISGYFGIRSNLKKLARLDLMVIFYDLIGLCVYLAYGYNPGAKTIIGMILPIISGRYWFLSCYFFLALLAPYIGILLEHLTKEQMERLILLLLVLFYVIPTFFYFQLMQDNGKGLPNMIVIYIIGRYLGKYPAGNRWAGLQKTKLKDIKWTVPKMAALFLANLCVIVGLNLATGKLTGSISTLWSRDCSLFILLSALLLFELFSRIHFKSRGVNRIAGSVLAVYVCSPFVQFVMEQYIDFDAFDGKVVLPFIIAGLVLVNVCVCTLVDQVRRGILGKANCRNHRRNKLEAK
jgi:hypothetical protein